MQVVCSYWIEQAAKWSLEIAPAFSPYPKPTQVDGEYAQLPARAGGDRKSHRLPSALPDTGNARPRPVGHRSPGLLLSRRHHGPLAEIPAGTGLQCDSRRLRDQFRTDKVCAERSRTEDSGRSATQ